jgi:mono/diheme cytochrome c family protein
MKRMKLTLLAVVIAAVWTVGVWRTVRADQGGTTWSGIYTEEQAKNGEGMYAKACSECHLDDLAGDGFAPALRGPEFMSNWNGLTVGDLFERIRISMPPSGPSSVSPKEKAEIVAYLLKTLGFPAGTTELASETAALKSIKFEAIKP